LCISPAAIYDIMETYLTILSMCYMNI